MTLPYSRNETATAANPVSSNLINAIQDAIIGGKRGPFTLLVHASAVALPATNVLYVSTVDGFAKTSGGGSAAGVDFPISGLIVGDRILTIDAWLFGNAVNLNPWALAKITGATGAVSFPAGGGDSAIIAAAWTKRTVTLGGGGYLVAADEALFMSWAPAATAMRVSMFALHCDHP